MINKRGLEFNYSDEVYMCQVQTNRPCLGGMTNWIIQNCERFDIESVSYPDGSIGVLISAKVKRSHEWVQAEKPREQFREAIAEVFDKLNTTVTSA